MLFAPPRLVALRAGDRVALLVEALPPLVAAVAATGADEATLVLDDRAFPVRLLHRRPAALEAEAGGRRFRAEGRLAMLAGPRGQVRDGVLSFRFGHDAPAPDHDAAPAGAVAPRRRDPRAPAVLPVTVVPVQAELPPERGTTLDLSGGGALLSGAHLAPGAPLMLHLELPSAPLPIPAAAQVVRATPEGLRAVRLERVRPADRARIARWVRAHGG